MAGVLGRAFVQVFADLSKFTPGLRKEIKRALDEQTKGLRFEELDKSAEKAGESAADEVGKGVDSKIEKNMKKEGKKGGNSLWQGLSTGFSAAATAFMPTLIALAVELVAALAPAVTALAATLPAAISAAIGAAVTLKLAFSGVGTALKDAFDPKKAAQFNAAMKKLAPSAQAFVKEIQKLHPAFHQMQQDIQQVFFNQLEGTLTRVSRNLLPTLHRGLIALSVDLGKTADGFLNAFGSRKADIASIFVAADRALKPFIPALAAVAGAFVTLAAAGGPLFATLSGGMAHLLVMFSQFIDQAAKSGALTQFFNDALVILKQFGGLLHNVFDLVTSIISALQADGAQALGFLSMLVGQLATFFRTAQGKQALANIFLLLNTALSTLQQVITPLLPVIVQLVGLLAGGLADALVKITPLLVSVATWLAKHPALLEAAAVAYGIFRGAILAVAAAEAIMDALDPLTWIVLAVAAIAAGAYLIYKNWDALVAALKSAWAAISAFFVGIWHWIVSVGKDIANWFTVTLPAFFASIPGRILAALNGLADLLWHLFLGALHRAGEAIGIGIGLILAVLIKWPDWLWDAVKSIGHLFVDLWHLALSTGEAVLRTGINAVIYIFTVLPGKVAAFVNRLPGIIAGAFRSAWDWAKREVTSGAEAVLNFVSRLPGRIAGFFHNVGGAILGGLRSGINSVISGFNSGIDKVGSMIHIGLPHLPLLASGGLVKAPTLAVVGEAGPEAVIPMGDPGRAAAVARQTGLLDMLGSRSGHAEATNVHVYLGTREITDILDVRIDKKMNDQANELAYGTR